VSVRVLPAVAAVLFAVVVAVLLFVPFVAREHRRRGELGAGTAALRFGGLLYSLGLVAYVLIPLPPVAPGFCEAFAYVQPQWEPFAGFEGLRWPQGWAELSPLVADDAVQQFGFNVLLFLPLGMFVRRAFRPLAAAVLIGFTASLAVELTQLTGIWFLYPCPYRLFDVDDLIANTTGAFIGGVLAPVLRKVPGQHSGTRATMPRPVTAYRRLLGMCCDALLLWWLGISVARATELTVRVTGVTWSPAAQAWWEAAALWFAPSLLLLAATAVGHGSTLGQHAVLLRSIGSAGHRPGPVAVLLRWSIGLGGLALIEGMVGALGWPRSSTALAIAWCTVHAFGVTRSRGHRGISGWLAGLDVLDARTLRPRDTPSPLATDH
jgi:glycopeptide antibiotics resistance protein